MNSNGKAQDLLDRVLAGKPEETKARVYELVLRLGISPHDDLFLVMIAMGQLQVLVEDAPKDWKTLFTDFQGELTEWSEINLECLNSLIRKAEQEEQLAIICEQLAKNSEHLVTFLTELLKKLDRLPQQSTSSKPTSSTPGLLERLASVENSQRQNTDMLTRLCHSTNRKLSAKVSLPAWATFLLAAIALSSIHTQISLGNINSTVGRCKQTSLPQSKTSSLFQRSDD